LSERLYWIGFSIAKGFGPVRIRRLLEKFGDLKTAWNSSEQEIASTGIDSRTLSSFRDIRSTLDLEAELARLDNLGIAVLTWEDDDYPASLAKLRSIDHAPHVLYVRGTLSEADNWSLAVVGTRSVSAYGRQVTHQLVTELVSAGLTIISGLARGADAEAHQAAIDAGGRTIALLPCGLDAIYPPENRKLAEAISHRGALISLFALGVPPESGYFAPRNRVMSGMSRGVLVTEAGIKSGALVTAQYALEQGREVFAVPGNITARGSSGTNLLIQEGAHPVLEAKDVLDILDIEYVAEYVDVRRTLPTLNDKERRVLEHLSDNPCHIDEVVRVSGITSSEVSSALMTLQLKGLVREVGQMVFVRSD